MNIHLIAGFKITERLKLPYGINFFQDPGNTHVGTFHNLAQATRDDALNPNS